MTLQQPEYSNQRSHYLRGVLGVCDNVHSVTAFDTRDLFVSFHSQSNDCQYNPCVLVRNKNNCTFYPAFAAEGGINMSNSPAKYSRPIASAIRRNTKGVAPRVVTIIANAPSARVRLTTWNITLALTRCLVVSLHSSPRQRGWRGGGGELYKVIPARLALRIMMADNDRQETETTSLVCIACDFQCPLTKRRC